MDVKYKTIVATLTEEILGGKFVPLGVFPSERALAMRFAVSRQTVQRVLRELNRRGLIYSRQGKGTFLTNSAENLRETVGLIVTGGRRTEIVSEIRDEVTRLARRMGLSLAFGDASSLNAAETAKRAMAFARDFVRRSVSGVILQPVEFHRDAQRVNARIFGQFAAAGIPVVLIDCDIVAPPDRSGLDIVGIDNFSAGRQLGMHLMDRRARNVVFLAQTNYPSTVRLRREGLASVDARFGNAKTLELSDLSVAALVRAFRRLDGVDAVVCQNDVAAINLLAALRKLGRRVPEDVLVAGFDDVTYAPLLHPSLTSVRQPCRQIADRAFDLLLERVGKVESPAEDVRMMPTLVVRASTGAAPTVKKVVRTSRRAAGE